MYTKPTNKTILYTVLIVLLLLTVLFNTGCGSLRDNCRLGGQTCDTLLGRSTWDDYDRINALEADSREQQRQLDLHQKEIDGLSTQANYMIADIRASEAQLATTNALLALLQGTVNANEASTLNAISILNGQIDQLNTRIDYNDTRIADMLVDIVELQQQDSVVEYIIPCGNRPNAFDETLLRTKSGKLLAYFESGGNRFLSILKPGNYRTTDGGKCYFTVTANMQLTNQYRQ